MFQTSHIEISRQAYNNNIDYLRKLIGPQVKFSSVIKGNAYGHGTANIISLAEQKGINHFSVFSADEALAAHKACSPGSDIMIMGFLDDQEIIWAVENNIEFYVFDTGRLESAVAASKSTGKKARIHLEVETGFRRTGFECDTIVNVIKFIKKNRQYICLEGVCTHYAGAESITNYYRIKEQIAQYRNFMRIFNRHDLKPLYRHTAGSAAMLTYPTTIMDMVRVGIAQYGLWPSPETEMYRFKRTPKK
jgi:alanine racemase